MDLDKHSLSADELANLYRAALYLGLNEQKRGLFFLRQTGFRVEENLLISAKRLELAEKILDEYKRRLRKK